MVTAQQIVALQAAMTQAGTTMTAMTAQIADLLLTDGGDLTPSGAVVTAAFVTVLAVA